MHCCHPHAHAIGILSLLPFLWILLPGQQFDRVWVLSLGCFIWGTMACAFAFSNTVLQGMFFWAFNGGQCVRHWQRWRHCAANAFLEIDMCSQAHWVLHTVPLPHVMLPCIMLSAATLR